VAFTYQRPGSKYVWMGFTLPNGQQKLMSSKLTDPNQALQVALSYERASTMARQKKLTDRTARKVLREIQLLAGIETLDGESAASFLQRRKEALKVRFRDGRTLERYHDVLDRWLKGNPVLAQEAIGAISRKDATDWRDHLLAVPLSPSTVNHHLITLTREFKEAKLQELITENPWEGVRVANAKKQRQHRRAFTWAHFTALLETTAAGAQEPVQDAAEWHLFIKIAGYMGQRRGDNARLQADQIDTQRRVVRFWRSKNKDWLEVPIHPALLPDLEAACKRHPTGPLLPALAARPKTGRTSLSDEFRQTILPRIGIVQPYNVNQERQGRKLAPYSIHSLRHALSTWLNEAGVSDVDRMRLVGHADRDVSQNYTHTGLEQAHRAIARLPKLKLARPGRKK
jgi:integrase